MAQKRIKIHILYDTDIRTMTGVDTESLSIPKGSTSAYVMNAVFERYPAIAEASSKKKVLLERNFVPLNPTTVPYNNDILIVSTWSILETRTMMRESLAHLIERFAVPTTVNEVLTRVFCEENEEELRDIILLFVQHVDEPDCIPSVVRMIVLIWENFPHHRNNGSIPL